MDFRFFTMPAEDSTAEHPAHTVYDGCGHNAVLTVHAGPDAEKTASLVALALNVAADKRPSATVSTEALGALLDATRGGIERLEDDLEQGRISHDAGVVRFNRYRAALDTGSAAFMLANERVTLKPYGSGVWMMPTSDGSVIPVNVAA